MDYIESNLHSIGQAIAYFSKSAKNIFLPLKPTYEYDLIIIKHLTIVEMTCRVKVIKTDHQVPSGSYVLNLRKSGGYKNKKEYKAPFKPSACDIVFAISPLGMYSIPSCAITQKTAISLSQFEQYRVEDSPS